MKVKCIKDNISALPKKMHKFAYTQDDKGKVDLTVGSLYEVYGIRKNKRLSYYLVLTDSIHHQLPWWMPANFFEVAESAIPPSWVTKTFGFIRKDTVQASPYYLEATDAIEDGDKAGYEAFQSIKKDNSIS